MGAVRGQLPTATTLEVAGAEMLQKSLTASCKFLVVVLNTDASPENAFVLLL